MLLKTYSTNLVWPEEARYIWNIMNIWILWNIWQTLCGLRKPESGEDDHQDQGEHLHRLPLTSADNDHHDNMIMMIMMITSGGDGHKIIKNDHPTLPLLLFCCSRESVIWSPFCWIVNFAFCNVKQTRAATCLFTTWKLLLKLPLLWMVLIFVSDQG